MALFTRAPTVGEFVEAWTREFREAVRAEASPEGLLGLQEARQIAQRTDALRVYGDTAISYLEVLDDGYNAVVGVDELVADRSRYVETAAAGVAGPSGRLTLAAARVLPNALAAAFEHLRGRTLPPPQGARLARRLAALAEGLWYGSEADYPFEPFSARMPRPAELSDDSFRTALGIPPAAELYGGSEDFDEFFRRQQDPQHWAEWGAEPEEARGYIAKYARLERAMRAQLSDLSDVTVGGEDVVEARVYFYGRARDGSLAGLRTVRVWT